jgi:3-oxoadipyl-CoA thiolase
LSNLRTDDLAAAPIRALIERNPAIVNAVDEVILGCANQAGEDNRNIARMAALLSGLPVSQAGTTVNRLCGSGLDAVGIAARAIRAGEIDLAIAGGVESMSRAPFAMAKSEAPFQRAVEIHDTTIGWRFINPLMKAQYGVDSMPETGENVAEEFGISRADQDAFALRSQARASAAQKRGFFDTQIIPAEVPAGRGKTKTITLDEHLRPESSPEALAALRPIVKLDGTVTAANSSGVNDGAAALILASDQAVEAYGLTPYAKVLGMATAGVPPRVMGIGPVPATQKLLERLSLKIAALDVVELNEAFASQALACLRELGLSDDAGHVNPNGGAIALGHPLGMSGARLAMCVTQHLHQEGGKYGLATMCVGVGQGISIAFERV